jgi:DNA-binding CsgD family transcriptional regulator
MKTQINSLLAFLSLLATGLAQGQEVPRIVNFSKQRYQAQHQNWSISQRRDFQLFIGNSAGLLQFDGANWQLHSAPAGQIVRSVAAGSDGRIYAGGYDFWGYWSAQADGSLQYTSLSSRLSDDDANPQEIWHILDTGRGMLFQSFSALYIYEADRSRKLSPPGNIMFTSMVHGKVITPVIGAGLYQLLSDDSFEKIPGSEVFKNHIVSAILPFGDSSMLVCTQDDGVFVQQRDGFRPWDCPLNRAAAHFQLNKAIALSNGFYAYGTVLNGVFIANRQGQILEHINQDRGLQNNTVLSLHEDPFGNLWAGLDRGLDLIEYNSPLRLFEDKSGELGTVYAAAWYDRQLFLGTNHGIFFKPYPARQSSPFRLLPGSQGQVWDLRVIDGILLAGHNAGSLIISGAGSRFIFNNTGVYTTLPHPRRQDFLLQGTYTGIIVLSRENGNSWRFSHELAGFFQPASKLIFDARGRLWVLHPRQGIFRLTLSDDLHEATRVERFGANQGLAADTNLDLFDVQGQFIVKSGRQFYCWQEREGLFKSCSTNEQLPLRDGDYRLVQGGAGEWFQCFADEVRLLEKDTPSLRVSMVSGYERIVTLPDSSRLFCIDDGYLILPAENMARRSQSVSYHDAPPLISSISTETGYRHLNDLSEVVLPLEFSPGENRLVFHFSSPVFAFQPAMRHRLLGFEDKWSSFQHNFSREFTNLPPGKYTFEVQSDLNPAIAAIDFIVLPRWYQTPWARFCYLLLAVLLFLSLVRWHHRRLDLQKKRLELEKIKELEQQGTASRNAMLQAEIDNQSRKLADVTMNLIRKNEMLLGLKQELEQAAAAKDSKAAPAALRKMDHLIEEHLSSEEDWEVFEANFNQLHNQFFVRLKLQYPELTPGDLRLAAYLKMNLASKEIAPLLNISLRGVENKRYRLRSKMGLDAEVNLTEYLMNY